MKFLSTQVVCLSLVAALPVFSQPIVISEIMYHAAPAVPENSQREWIEIHNAGTNSVVLTGWRLVDGVDFAFATNTVLESGAFLVIAANRTAFQAQYPGVANVVGDWVGQLSNSGEKIELADAFGDVVASVRYADGGDWAVRQRVPDLNAGLPSWDWQALHDGQGPSLELRNPDLPIGPGQNWGASQIPGGTPGTQNSLFSQNVAPLILETAHFPAVPTSVEPVTVTARLIDESPGSVTASVFYRDATSASASAWVGIAMLDDGAHNDGGAGDGVFGAVLPVFPLSGTVVEFYVQASDGLTARTWPAPALDGVLAQTANAMYQVDDTLYSGDQPMHRLVLTGAERQTLLGINPNSDAQMNLTMVVLDGVSAQIRYSADIRIRGAGSRGRPTKNYRVNIPSDRPWNGLTSINLNSQYPHAQMIGSVVAQKAGLPAANARLVQVRINGQNLARSGPPVSGDGASWGSYVLVEPINNEWAERIFPTDSNGNVYRASSGPHLADLSHQGTSPDSYLSRGYSKTSNQAEYDWSDLTNLTYVLNLVPAQDYTAAVTARVNVREWMTYFATFSLMEYTETALGSGEGDDFSLYRGVIDQRFQLMGHDFDTIFGQGDAGGNINENIFIAADAGDQPAVDKFMKWLDFAPLYYEELHRLATTVFATENLNPVFDQFLTTLVTEPTLVAMKNFSTARAAAVLNQIPQSIRFNNTIPALNGYPRTTVPSANLSGFANAIRTRLVRVNGAVANWVAWQGAWNIAGVPLLPGINRVLVQSFDAQGVEFDRNTFDVWYDDGSIVDISSDIVTDTTLTAAGGPYRITTTLEVLANLVIEPGTTIYLGGGASLLVEGRLVAEGTETRRIRFTREPGATTRWGGIVINGGPGSPETRISHAHIEFNNSAAIHSSDGTVFLDHLTFGSTDRQYVSLDRSSFVVSECVFPTATAAFELVHGSGGIKSGGRGIFLRNFFGVPIGYNDVVDFTGGNRPAPIVQFLNNVFVGATDDILDLDSTDAWVEGNIFLHTHKNGSPDSASAVSGGADNADTSQVTIIGNLFYDCDQAANAKQGNFYTLLNNTIVRQTRQGGTDTDSGVLILGEDGFAPGAGAYVEGNIIYDAEKLVRNPGTALVTFTNNLMSLPWTGAGGGNTTNLPPLFKRLPRLAETTGFTNWAQAQVMRDWFSLQPGSPARGAGPDGRDQGGAIPLGVSIAGEPTGTTVVNTATLTVGVNRAGSGIPTAGFPNGSGFTHYRWRLNGGSWSAEMPIETPIALSGLPNGSHYVEVSGRRDSGFYQDDPVFGPDATVSRSRSWTVSSSFSSIRINEVLARNESVVTQGGGFPDVVEIVNAGSADVDISGWGISDESANQFKFKFPAGTIITAGQHLLLFSENTSPNGFQLGFGLAQEGDSVHLYNSSAALVDAVQFGAQLPDLTIGRAASGQWTLCSPTLGSPNKTHPLAEPSALKINEWLANGRTLYPEDFIEIYNPNAAPVSLGGLHLTDEPLGWPGRYRIVPLTFMGAGQHFVFIADGRIEEGSDHVGFKLSASQGALGLFDAVTNLIDCIFYGPQVTDLSEGRSPSGAARIGRFSIATPGGPNPSLGGGTVVSNITVNLLPMLSTWRYDRSNTPLAPDWITAEYNDSDWLSGLAPLGFEPDNIPFPVNTSFGGYNNQQVTYYFRTTFTVDTSTAGFALSMTSELDDGAIIFLNGQEVARPNMPLGTIFFGTLPLSSVQNATVENVPLIPNAITNLVQGQNVLAVEVHNAANPTSSDLVWALQVNATRTVTNLVGASILLNEVLARNSSFTNAGGTNLADWVELYNPSANVIDLTGLSLSDRLDTPARWVFPPGVSVAPGQHLLVRFDADAPPSTVAGDILNTGFGLDGNGGDAVYLFDTPQRFQVLLDSVVFGVQIPDYSIGRPADGASGWVLNLPTPESGNIVAALGDPSRLKVNEWLASPSGNDDDFFEIYNPNPQPVDLSSLFFSDSLTNRTASPVQDLSFIGTGDDAFVRFIADGNTDQGADHASFSLRAAGESVAIFSAKEVLIDAYTFVSHENGVSEGRFPDGSTNIVRFRGTTTPGRSNLLPLDSVVINEVLTHTDLPYEDAIELRNVSGGAVDLSGWYLSDRRNDPKRFRIPIGTVLSPGGFIVFYEAQFNPDLSGRPPYFGLNSTEGEELFLFTADTSGNLTGFRTGVKFGAGENAVSFGRYQTSVDVDFTAMTLRTFGFDNPTTVTQFRTGTGLSNSSPLVGPIVISEIMYRPPDVISGGTTNDDDHHEFIELRNTSSEAVPLFHPGFPTNSWRLRDAVDFNFPLNVTLPVGGFALVVGFDPSTNAAVVNAFRSRYNIAGTIPIFGPWQGKLGNSGENIELYKPDAPQPPGSPDAGFVPYIEVDKVKYVDVAPWPALADGNTNGVGMSLQRRVFQDYGNDPVNWIAGVPTPGSATGPGAIAPPSITSLTPPHDVLPNANDSLTVVASGAGPLIYQWRFNGVIISGAVSPTLLLNNFQAAKAGVYSVLVVNGAGAASASTRVELRSVPVIVRQPQDQLAPTNGTAVFTVVAGGTQPLAYQWRRGEVNIADATGPALVVNNVQLVDAVSYRVVISNVYGSITSSPAALNIVSPPVIVAQPQGTNVFVSQSVNFNVAVFGSPPLRYQWRFNNANIPNATNATLNLANVQLTDAGTYSVRVTNAFGTVFSDAVVLDVSVAPTISIVATDAEAGEEGNPGLFTLSRSGSNGAPQLVYFVVGGNAIESGDYTALTSPITIPAGSSSVTIPVTILNDSVREGDETVTVTLSSGLDYVAGPPAVAVVTIRDDDNLAPTVAVSSPEDGTVVNFPGTLVLNAIATDGDGSIGKVAYFDNATNFLGESTSEPFAVIWTNGVPGVHQITAVATDDLGATGISVPVSVIVNTPPTVVLTAPGAGAVLNADSDVSVTANANDADGSVALVEFFRDGTFLGSDATSPFSVVWSNAQVGSYTLTARATDNRNGVGVSASISVMVIVPPPGFRDNFINRGVITGFTNSLLATNTTYTREAGEPRHDNRSGTRSAWISWTAPGSGTCTIDTIGSNFDTVVAIYTGNSVSTLTRIASNDDADGNTVQSRVAFSVIAGTVYQIAVDGYAANSGGRIVFRISLPNLGPTIAAHPQGRIVDAAENVSFTVAATGAGSLTYQWRFNGLNIVGATGSTYFRGNIQHVDGGMYSVLVSTPTGSVVSQNAALTVRPAVISTEVTGGNFRIVYHAMPNRAHAIDMISSALAWTPLITNSSALVERQFEEAVSQTQTSRLFRIRIVQ